ncbi:MAG TPA: hypothetical protein DDW50_14750, partial [Firmicutes bacterium]|nr:hypothetical protein [Bacillota bacterium]
MKAPILLKALGLFIHVCNHDDLYFFLKNILYKFKDEFAIECRIKLILENTMVLDKTGGSPMKRKTLIGEVRRIVRLNILIFGIIVFLFTSFFTWNRIVISGKNRLLVLDKMLEATIQSYQPT